jgi:putative membrane-bound dehydrogenase-like protein
MRLLHIAPLILIGVSSAMILAADPPADSADRDYAGELPRIPATEPKEALAKFRVAPGFKVEQVAAEPLVADPIALSFDENGRLFVVEMRGYSENDGENLSRITLLEDTDGDGRFDKSHVFADGLSWPTAIICWGGGVFVGDAPHIYYFRDADGDNRADQKEIVYTGFGKSNVQGLLNTFLWGLDNRIHGATSSSGATILPSPSGRGAPLVLRGRDFSFDPRTRKIEAESGGGQHGMSFDRWGRKFVCSNSDHLQLVMFDDRYLARNPYLAAPSPRTSIAADGPQADVFRESPVEPWRIVRTRLRVKGVVPGPVEGGGRAAGYFTGATGVTLYRGNAWPEKFLDYAIVGDVGSNLVHRKVLEPNGVGLVGRRVDEKSELVASTDIWFRPVQFANAPDGTLYILDMYREVIEHPASLPSPIKKHLDLTSGRNRGRIYRIVPDGFKQPALPKLGKANTAELVATLAHQNGWHRDTAARLINQRQDRAAIVPLEKLAADAKVPEGRMHALYALHGLAALSPEVVRKSLDDKHPRVREHAVRLAEHVVADSPPVSEKLLSLVNDDDLRVRYQLAFSLGELPGPRRNRALADLARKDGGDRWIKLAVQSSLGQGAGAVLADLAADKDFRRTDSGLAWLRDLAAQIGKQQRADDIAALLRTLSTLPAEEKRSVQAIVQGVAAKADSPLSKQIAAATGGRADELAKELLAASAATAGDTAQTPEARAAAVQLLRLGTFAGQQGVLAELLDPKEPAEVQSAALATLATFDAAEVSSLLLARWSRFSPRTRSQAADVLLSRGAWLAALLSAVEEERIALGDLDPGRVKALSTHADEAIRNRAAKLAARLQTSRRTDVLAAYRKALDAEGDAPRGKEIFKKVCAACHQVQGVGHALAPSLAAMKARGPEAIMTNVLDPNREVNPQYVSYTLVTTDGRTLSGMISAETATSVTLKRADNQTDTVLRIDIDVLKSTGLSLMPEGLEKQLDVTQMADLLAFLKSVE